MLETIGKKGIVGYLVRSLHCASGVFLISGSLVNSISLSVWKVTPDSGITFLIFSLNELNTFLLTFINKLSTLGKLYLGIRVPLKSVLNPASETLWFTSYIQ